MLRLGSARTVYNTYQLLFLGSSFSSWSFTALLLLSERHSKDLRVPEGSPVIKTYRESLFHATGNRCSQDPSSALLRLSESLGFNEKDIGAGSDTSVREAAHRLKSKCRWQSRQVLLFSGHMIDAPDRDKPRFPAAKEAVAARKIAETLGRLDAGPEDLALTQGSCGGDILFAEACLKRGVRLTLLQPFDEAQFIEKSVLPGGESWRIRYDAIKPHARIKSAPVELGPAPEGVNPYERCNLWLLYTALAFGIEKVRFICLWNGEGGDAPGGTAHMYHEVNDKSRQVYWLNTRELW